MGNHLSCIDRENFFFDQNAPHLQPILSQSEVGADAEQSKQSEQSKAPTDDEVKARADELRAKVNAIVKAHDDQRHCLSCFERENFFFDQDATPLKPLLSQSEVGANAEQPTDDEVKARADDLRAKVNAIVKAHADQRPSGCLPDAELQNRINAIVKARAERPKPSPVACSLDGDLQAQISSIVAGHAKSLKYQRLSCTHDSAADPAYLASPSPAKSVSDMELAYYANLVLSQARERSTPSQSPASFYVPCTPREEDIAPCQLSFADLDDTSETQIPAVLEPDHALSRVTQAKEACVNGQKAQSCPIEVMDIPSPTRNLAKRQQSLWEQSTNSVEGLPCHSTLENVQQTFVANGVEGFTQEDTHEKVLPQAVEELEAGQLNLMEESRLLQETDASAQLAAMDRMCVFTFLESVKKCAWREKVQTPIKGSNLYTKHMRPCRPAGTSVDVKDSSFRSLCFFLEFLEHEGLIRLKPGVSDPVVTAVNFDACRKYRYNPQLGAIKAAPHNAGCSCRKCLSTAQWQ